VIYHYAPQGTEAWLESRRGVITGSRCKDARDKTRAGKLSAKGQLYAMDTARERAGGRVLMQTWANAAMRFGTEQEPIARDAYEIETGEMVELAGFITTDDGRFGISVDGLIGSVGMWECKTMVSSDTLFTAVVRRDISAYIDQINMSLWLLHREWCDLTLWAPDLAPLGREMTVIRIERDDNEIERLESDLIDGLVEQYRVELEQI